MMKRLAFRVFYVAALGATTLGGAGAADAPAKLKILRHLKFEMTYGIHSTRDVQVSGFGGEVSGASHGSGTSDEKHGSITVDVVAATADGGLAVDVFEETPARTPTVRFGVTDKKLMYDPAAAFTDEERMLVHYLARDLVQPTELDTGTTWVDTDSGKDYSVTTKYKITSVDAAAKTVGVDISGTSDSSGLAKTQAVTTGSMLYDTGTSVPQSLSITTRTLTSSGPSETQASSQLTAKLVEDSFHKT